jgi:hypothetical protein
LNYKTTKGNSLRFSKMLRKYGTHIIMSPRNDHSVFGRKQTLWRRDGEAALILTADFEPDSFLMAFLRRLKTQSAEKYTTQE